MVDRGPELSVKQSGFGGRGYKHPLTGQVVPGVTTITGAAHKPALLQWVVDQTAAFAVANIDSLLNRSELQGWGFLRWYHKRNPLPLEEGTDIRNFHVGVLNDAAELGTSMHDLIEADVDNRRPYPDTSFEPPQFHQMVPVWEQFKSEHTIEPLFTEATVWNSELGYAGTFDGLWLIDGKLYLIDIKTSRNTWPEHHMQLAALLNADVIVTRNEEGEWVEIPLSDFQIEGVKIIHIRPDDTENDGTPKPAYIEMLDGEDLDLHWNGFKGLLMYKTAERAITQRRNEEKAAARAAKKEEAKSQK